jgi:hypothetical protein
VFQPELRALVVESYRRWLGQIAGEVEAGQADGSIPARTPPADVAHQLAAVLDGLGQQVMLGGLSRERAVELLRAAIARELGLPTDNQEAA